MKREVLKSLALKAKNRLIHKKEGKDFIAEFDQAIDVKIITDEDEIFYDKVKALLEEDQDIINPIKKLMDENYLLRLDARARERYLLDTIDKYHKTRKMIEQERALIC